MILRRGKGMVYKIILLCFLFMFSGCQNEAQKNDYIPMYSTTQPLAKKVVYIFGVHPLHNPKRLFEVYGPMIDYINAHLKGGELRLEASRDYPAFDKKLAEGYFDLALPNPYQMISAADHGYKIFAKMGDDQNFRGIILVRKDSQINSIDDLRGKTVSYPAPTALAGTMMPQWYLYKHGIDIKKDIKNSYVGSQESSIMNVYLGKSAAAATWPPPWKAFIKERPEVAKEVMIKWETPALLNNGLVARRDIPDTIVEQVSQIVTTLHTHEEGREILKAMELSRYEKADDKTYEPVREFLKKFENEVRPIKDNT
jgi:phosphonate transport system substrate-binding protein